MSFIRPDILGVDIGEVLIAQSFHDPALSFRGENYLNSPEMPDAFRVLRRLRDERFGDSIFLITRCHRKLRDKRVEWLDHHKFFERTGLPRILPHYCWNPYNKSHVCHDLGMTHFIDNEPAELIHLEDLIPNLILFHPKVEHVAAYERFVRTATTRVETWNAIEVVLLPPKEITDV